MELPRFQGAIIEAFQLVRWYAREHVLLCLVPAFFIAGAIGVFVSQNAVMKYFGPKANKALSYGVASVSGTILAVCSCTVLPLFGSIYMRGAGLGPAIAFLYSGPAINVLAIVLTARVLGWQLGVARAVGAVVFSVVIGLLMHLIFLKEERAKAASAQEVYLGEDDAQRAAAVAGGGLFPRDGRHPRVRQLGEAAASRRILVRDLRGQVDDHGRFRDPAGVGPVAVLQGQAPLSSRSPRFRSSVIGLAVPRYPIAAFAAGAAGLAVLTFFGGAELKDWRDQTWGFAKQILPLLLVGVLAAGFFLGSPTSTDAGSFPITGFRRSWAIRRALSSR